MYKRQVIDHHGFPTDFLAHVTELLLVGMLVLEVLPRRLDAVIIQAAGHLRGVAAFQSLCLLYTSRMDADLKAQADALFTELGMNLTTAFHIFVRQSQMCIRDRIYPVDHPTGSAGDVVYHADV